MVSVYDCGNDEKSPVQNINNVSLDIVDENNDAIKVAIKTILNQFMQRAKNLMIDQHTCD
jgi:hypothetical protein